MIYLILVIITGLTLTGYVVLKKGAHPYTALITVLVFTSICFAIVGYTNTTSAKEEHCIKISSTDLSRIFTETPIESLDNYKNETFIITGVVDSVITFDKKYMTLLNCGEYPEIYIENCIRQKGQRITVKGKIKDYTGFVLITPK